MSELKSIVKILIRFILSPFVLGDFYFFDRLKNNIKDDRFELNVLDLNPQIRDKTIGTGFDRHYVYHTSWAARKVKEINPTVHTDISSSLYFCGIVSAFLPVNFYDYRPAALYLSNLKSEAGNLHSLPFQTESIDSLSCMHTIEHVGLGRYGDPIDPKGDIKAIEEIKRVLKSGGSFLYVAPIGKKALIEFNAHRIYTYDLVMSMMGGLTLKEFSLIPEFEKDGGIILNADPKLLENEHYACGCFHFVK